MVYRAFQSTLAVTLLLIPVLMAYLTFRTSFQLFYYYYYSDYDDDYYYYL